MPHVASYGMIIQGKLEANRYWGLQQGITQPTTMEMYAANRLLNAVAKHDVGTKVEIFTNGRNLNTRIEQALDKKIALEAGRNVRPILDQEMWFETAMLWHSMKVGIRTPSTDQEKMLLQLAQTISHEIYDPSHAISELVEDGVAIEFED